MDNYKIKVKDEAESKEAQELFFELGYSWQGCGKYYNRIGNYAFITAYPDEMLLRMGWGGDTDKELTLPQLRDLVVLKRNDVKDSNCTYRLAAEEKNYAGYLGSNDWMHIFKDGRWQAYVPIVSEELKAFYLNSKAKDPALISGAEALRALADGKEVEYRYGTSWESVTGNQILITAITGDKFAFRLKPQTIKLELEIPAPYKAKIGGRDDTSFVLNVGRHQYCYKNEEDYTKARDALEAVFDAAVRGTNS